jgi:hypothetical protein
VDMMHTKNKRTSPTDRPPSDHIYAPPPSMFV